MTCLKLRFHNTAPGNTKVLVTASTAAPYRHVLVDQFSPRIKWKPGDLLHTARERDSYSKQQGKAETERTLSARLVIIRSESSSVPFHSLCQDLHVCMRTHTHTAHLAWGTEGLGTGEIKMKLKEHRGGCEPSRHPQKLQAWVQLSFQILLRRGLSAPFSSSLGFWLLTSLHWGACGADQTAEIQLVVARGATVTCFFGTALTLVNNPLPLTSVALVKLCGSYMKRRCEIEGRPCQGEGVQWDREGQRRW